MELEKVDEIEHEPIVGQSYLVPSLITTLSFIAYVPVYGPEHEDSQFFNFDKQHFHYDSRFLTYNNMVDIAVDHRCLDSRGLSEDRLSERLTTFVFLTNRGTDLEYRPFVCQRPMPISFLDLMAPKAFRAMENHYSEHKLSCKTCPHRGFRLNGLPEDANGDVVCPGHGLKWNVKSGKLVKRI